MMPRSCGSPSSSAVTIHGPSGPCVSNDLPMRHRRGPQLPVAHGHVVGDRVARDHLVAHAPRERGGSVFADHDRQLALVVEKARDARHVDVVAGPHHARHLLVEEDRELGRLHAALGDVVGIVKPDRQGTCAAGPARAAGPPSSEYSSSVLTIDDLLAFDHAVTRATVCLKSAQLHLGASFLSVLVGGEVEVILANRRE